MMDAGPHSPASLVPRPVRVVSRREEFDGAATLRLGTGPFPFAPGQFVMVSRPGVGEVPISICGDPVERNDLVLTVRAVGAVTDAIVAAREGTWLGIRGPYGTAWPLGEALGGDLLVVAGGLGMAAVRAAFLAALADTRIRRVVLLYGTREPGAILFRDDLAAFARTRAEVHVTVDAAKPGWSGHVGLVTTLIERAGIAPERTTAFLCGPEVMMRFVVRDLAARGLPPERIHVSLERHMACGTGLCGRCQLGPFLLCRDGPVVRFSDAARPLAVAEL